jgi:hypothetical protein
MTNTVLIKRSSTANAVPSAGNLVAGELALNYTDGNLFYKNAGNVVTVIASNQFSSVTGNITGGNILTGGLVSATSTITSAANVTGGNLLTVGQISATGNITGNFYIGNGAFLTGLSAGTADQIANGATSIAIPVSSGNIAMSVTGQSNTVVINLGSLTMYGTFAGPKTLAANVAVADAVNALLIGPVTLGNGFNIAVPDSSTLYVYAP